MSPRTPRQSWFGRLTTVMNAAGSCLILLIMVAILSDILGRFLFDRPVPGVPEIVAMSIAAIVFLQFASTLRARRVIMSDGFLNWLATKSVRWEQRLLAFYHLLGGLMFSIVGYFVFPLVTRAFGSGDFYGVLAVFTFPKWPVYGTILLGCVVMALQYFSLAWQYVTAAAQGRRLSEAHDSSEAVIS
jgi:TRAP-type mannitol/chloroaromatic compound transport system permease small subunit